MIDYIGPAGPYQPGQQVGAISTQTGEHQIVISTQSVCDSVSFTACADGTVGTILSKQGQVYAAAFLPCQTFKDLYKEFMKHGLKE